ncbi:SMP-30/gluconolactonase/LRE family protein [Schlesneria sp.]|uniref:SMP-30/gluconolactonase/LRE family protein n=1 Tax=Schlesneria sp. TaxID=2762018 RepID=UPI002EE1B97A
MNLHGLPMPPGVLSGSAVATSIAFTEGPACDSTGNLYFTDIVNNRILVLEKGSKYYRVFREPSGRANGLLFDVEGRLLACEGNEFCPNDGNRRITRTDLRTGAVEVLTDRFEGKRYNAPNDIAACSSGQLFFTDPCYYDRSTMELDHDSIYRIDPDGPVTRVLTQPEIQRPNGIALSPDERTLYVVDSCTVAGGHRRIWAFDLSSDGTLSQQRLVFDFAPGRGGDGMCVDSQGTLYIAAGISRARSAIETDRVPTGIYVVRPDGTLLGCIPIDEDIVTNCTWGGPDLKTLYVTAGKTVYQIQVEVPGWVVHRSASSRG